MILRQPDNVYFRTSNPDVAKRFGVSPKSEFDLAFIRNYPNDPPSTTLLYSTHKYAKETDQKVLLSQKLENFVVAEMLPDVIDYPEARVDKDNLLMSTDVPYQMYIIASGKKLAAPATVAQLKKAANEVQHFFFFFFFAFWSLMMFLPLKLTNFTN